MAERALVQSRLARMSTDLQRARADQDSALQHLRELWREGFERDLADHQKRLEALRAEQAAWFSNFVDGEATEPASTPDVVVRPGPRGAPLPSPSGSSQDGHSPAGQRPQDPHAAELAEASRIKGLSMQAFAAERQRLIRADQSIF
jgi:hypothetical protein